MILRTIRLHPFAGVGDRHVNFQPGLNVVLGPNEAGKSTLVNALRMAMFCPTDCRANSDLGKEIKTHLPQVGGDTVCVSLDCQTAEGSLRIVKMWGGEKRSELRLPDGSLLTSTKDVNSRLESLLKVKQGTWENVLISRQTLLAHSLSEMEDDDDTTADLAQLLRKAVLSTDGVSIDRLKSIIAGRLKDVESRWDVVLQRPEKNRGVDNPWKAGGGSLLKAWYAREKLASAHAATVTFERDMDEVNAKLNGLVIEVDELGQHVKKWKPVVEAELSREITAAKLDKANRTLKKLKEVMAGWPNVLAEIKSLEANHPELERRITELTAELKKVQAYNGQKVKRAKLKQALTAQDVVTESQKAADRLKPIPDDDFRELTNVNGKREKLETALSAGKLQVRIEALQPTDLQTQSGFSEANDQALTAGEIIEFTADGQATISDSRLRISVESGTGDFPARKVEYKKLKDVTAGLLMKLDVAV